MAGWDYPSVTATVVVGLPTRSGLKVLLARRKALNNEGKPNVFGGYWCLPGGFLNVKNIKKKHPGETGRECASRELLEETCIKVNPADWKLIDEYSDPAFDPRTDNPESGTLHVVNLAYLGIVHPYQLDNMRANDDVDDLDFFQAFHAEKMDLAFNHNQILADALNTTIPVRSLII